MFYFNQEKNIILKQQRGINFDEIIDLMDSGHLLDVVDHPQPKKYPGQRIYVVDVRGYIHLVPFIKDGETTFLKTIYPSRKATKLYNLKKEYKNVS